MSFAIGLYPFFNLDRMPAPFRQTMDDRSNPGVDGTAVMFLGKKGEITPVIGEVDVANEAAAVALAQAYAALVGTTLSVTYLGQTIPYVLVVDVDVPKVTPVTSALGGLIGGNFWVTSQWLLQRTAE